MLQFNYYWFYKKYLPDRKDEPCRVLARGKGKGPRNVLVEFADGTKVVSTRFCVRKKMASEKIAKWKQRVRKEISCEEICLLCKKFDKCTLYEK